MSSKETVAVKYKSLLKTIKTHLLVIATFSSVVLGVIVGSIIRATTKPWTSREIMYVNFVGELFLRLLKSLILPLIATSLLSGISSLNLKLSRKIGGRAIAFYLTTTFLAVVLGIFLVTWIEPGADRHAISQLSLPTVHNNKTITTTDTLLDLLRNLFPPNLIQMCLETSTTVLELPKACTEMEPNCTGNISSENCTDIPKLDCTDLPLEKYDVKPNFVPGTNVMGVVVISIVVGIAMSKLHAELTHFTAVIREFYTLMIKITVWATSLSPIGIFFLVVAEIIKMEDLREVGQKLGYYFLTVVLGCLLQGFVILPIIYFVFTRKNPFVFIRGLSQALMNAFGTSSSTATMPITLHCIVENNKVDQNVAKFMLPIGAAINMDGTALYEAVAAIFISQMRRRDLSFGKLVAVSITATAASIGAAGIPSAGLVTMIMVLDTVGLPAEDISLILSVDWLLDRIRTVVNVLGDAFGAGIVNHISRDDIIEFNNRKTSSNIAINELSEKSHKNQSSISLHRANELSDTSHKNQSGISLHRAGQSNVSIGSVTTNT